MGLNILTKHEKGVSMYADRGAVSISTCDRGSAYRLSSHKKVEPPKFTVRSGKCGMLVRHQTGAGLSSECLMESYHVYNPETIGHLHRLYYITW